MTEIADTAENRPAAGRRFLATMPVMSELLRQVGALAPTSSSEKQAVLARRLQADGERLERETMDALVRHFSAPKIEAMTRLYASPEGRSLLEKLPAYTADLTSRLMPLVQPAIEEFLKP
jgi:hypothetical protein